MAKKAYIITLSYGSWRNQLWFSAEEDYHTQKKWNEIIKALDELGDTCSHAGDYFDRSLKLFEENGFVRIQK
jgi:hypothetical protein